jgi:site-specific recombinase XerD
MRLISVNMTIHQPNRTVCHDYCVTDTLLDLDLESLMKSWMRVLKSQHKSPHTLRGYRSAVQSYLDYCAGAGLPAVLSADNLIAYMGDHPGETSTAKLHLVTLKLFAKWLASEEDFDADAIVALRPPKGDQRTVPDLSEADIDKLLKACDGRTLLDKRDKALLVLFTETGLRAGEMVALDVGDVDIDGCVCHVRRGKGGKGRRVRFSLGAAATLDRYLRARRQAVSHPAEGPLWVGHRSGTRLSYRGLTVALKARAVRAKVDKFHVHRLRHTAAVRWLRHGGSEVGLMAQSGWSSHTMVDRYVRAASESLAADEFDRLQLGVVDL